MSAIDREAVWRKYGGKCAYCGHSITLEEMQVDHIVPKRAFEGKEGDPNTPENLNPSCAICNHYKSSTSLDEFRYWLLGDLHIRITKLPKVTNVPATKRRKAYLQRVCERYGITPEKPFSRVFYFERAETGELAENANS